MERITHQPTESLVVFQIGMRFTKPWRVDAWAPVFVAMPRMLRELASDPGSGMLAHRLLLGERGITVLQYWRDVDALYAYANDESQLHRPAWKAFYAAAKRVPGAVGIWHETYEVARAESMYVQMPTTGLAKALGAIPVGAHNRTARTRIDQRPARR